MQPIPPRAESYTDLRFPVSGIDLLRAFSDQQGQTTPAGVNVLTFEPGTLRGRGGSRPGIARFIDQALPLTFVSGSRLIQHLGSVVQVDGTALLNNYPFLPADFLDPSDAGPSALWPPGQNSRNPGWTVPNGGTGIQPNKSGIRHAFLAWSNPADITVGTALSAVQLNAQGEDPLNAASIPGSYVYNPPAGTFLSVGNNQPLQVTFTPSGNFISSTKTVHINVKKAGIQFVQAASADPTVAGVLSLNSNVGAGDLLLVAFCETGFGGGGQLVITPTDSLGNTYAQIGSTVLTSAGVRVALTLWYAVSNAAGSCTVTGTQAAPGNLNFSMAVLEYSGTAPTAVVDANVSNFDNTFAASFTTTALGVNGSGELAVAIFAFSSTDGLPWVFGNSFTSRIQLLPLANSACLLIGDLLNQAAPVTGTASSATDTESYAAIGASFKPA